MNSARKTSAASRTENLFAAVEPKQFALFSGEHAPRERAPLFVGSECLKPGVRPAKKASE